MYKKLIILMFATLALTSCQENFDHRCAREAHDYTTKMCPLTVDKNGVVMDSMTYDKNTRTISYSFHLFGMLDNDTLVNKAYDKFHNDLIKNVRGSLDLKMYKDKGIKFNYVYYSKKSGKKLMNISIGPEDYK
jgi:non-homologous end joining protein Ku